jgi:hypothetical protein
VRLRIDFVDYRTLTFAQQLGVLRDADIYVSGPGTALGSVFMLGDHSASLNVGGIQAWNTTDTGGGDDERVHVQFFEEYLTSSNQFGFFYPQPQRLPLIRSDILRTLLNQTAYHILYDKPPPVDEPHMRLSAYGRTWFDFCAGDARECAMMLLNFNSQGRGHYYKLPNNGPIYDGKYWCSHYFAEEMVDEMMSWSERGYHGAASCQPNIGRMRQIREKYQKMGLYAPPITMQKYKDLLKAEANALNVTMDQVWPGALGRVHRWNI